ncbi:hypothetical protein OIU85_004429 [Salix viminalis]|uniref:SAC domain-containing protein n=1 Tax=Salix viminalis TaxID=40686 RepID=A0A9Q0SXG2_SALVM|nr:hypothetical protein OIU85_004429 [Salix viminalis]
MQSLQKNVISIGEDRMPYDNIFVWNAYLTRAIRSRCSNTIWTIALVHGNFKQIRLSIFGRGFSVLLVSRRSRHFAGTRYLKRGVNDMGRVANDVETEQIVLDEDAGCCKGKMSSVVQMRGSIPLFWSQEASRFSPKPDIILQRYDPTYQATKLHFEDLVKRYGSPIIVLNLIKTVEKRPREMMLRREFATAAGYLNTIFPEEKKLQFIHWDFHKFAKSKSANVLAVLGAVASQALDLTGFYYSGKSSTVKRRANHLSRTSTGRDASLRDLRASSGDLAKIGSNNENLNSMINRDRESDSSQLKKQDEVGAEGLSFQSGVLRTNCIDCLDRTNVAQYAYGLAAFGRQLLAMGLTDMPKVDPDSTVAAALMDMYRSMGDALAQQYGGSAAHNTMLSERQGKWKATAQSREFIKSIKRYYNNTYTDGEKQDAINLFLGYFQPREGKSPLWELDSDYYLHVYGNAIGEVDPPYPDNCNSESNAKPVAVQGNSGVAPDAVEIQLKTPNWLFGQKKYEESGGASKAVKSEIENGASCKEIDVDGYSELNLLSSVGDINEEDIFRRYLAMTSVDEASGWYGGTLLCDPDESSEIYKHYTELCQGAAMDPFEHDLEKEKHYADVLRMNTIDVVDDSDVEAEMEAALKDYERIGADLGILPMSCKSFATDPSWLTRWIIGEEKVEKV